MALWHKILSNSTKSLQQNELSKMAAEQDFRRKKMRGKMGRTFTFRHGLKLTKCDCLKFYVGVGTKMKGKWMTLLFELCASQIFTEKHDKNTRVIQTYTEYDAFVKAEFFAFQICSTDCHSSLQTFPSGNLNILTLRQSGLEILFLAWNCR